MEIRIPLDHLAAKASRVTHLFLDCDGVMTDGSIFVTPDGDEIKRFDVRDGHGVVLWRRAGHKAGIISGRGGSALERRAEELKMDYLIQRSWNKLESFRELLDESGILPEEVAFMGDDVVDIPLMLRAGIAAAPANAVPEVIAQAHVVTDARGGAGAVRELVEFLLKQQQRWDALMARYLV